MTKAVETPAKAKPGPKPKLTLSDELLAQLRALGGIQATVEECAAVLQVSLRTLQNFFIECPDAKDAHEAGKDNGKASLRRKQFAMAETNATMAIWLGKQYLGQKDITHNENVNTYVVSDKPMSTDEWESKYCLETPGRTTGSAH